MAFFHDVFLPQFLDCLYFQGRVTCLTWFMGPKFSRILPVEPFYVLLEVLLFFITYFFPDIERCFCCYISVSFPHGDWLFPSSFNLFYFRSCSSVVIGQFSWLISFLKMCVGLWEIWCLLLFHCWNCRNALHARFLWYSHLWVLKFPQKF